MKLITEVKGILSCWYDEETATTQHDWWTNFLLRPEERIKTRLALELFLDFIEVNPVCKHIVNLQYCTEPFEEADLDWLTNYLVPKEVYYGIKYTAHIVPDDDFTPMAAGERPEKVESGMIVKNFVSLKEAHVWLAAKQ